MELLNNQFTDDVVWQAWERSHGVCECTLVGHGHMGQCAQPLLRENRGRDSDYHWEAHHLQPWGAGTLDNCAIFCWPCHKATLKG